MTAGRGMTAVETARQQRIASKAELLPHDPTRTAAVLRRVQADCTRTL